MHTCNHTFSVNDYLNEMHIERVEDMDAARAEEYARIDALYGADWRFVPDDYDKWGDYDGIDSNDEMDDVPAELEASWYAFDDRRELIDGPYLDRCQSAMEDEREDRKRTRMTLSELLFSQIN